MLVSPETRGEHTFKIIVTGGILAVMILIDILVSSHNGSDVRERADKIAAQQIEMTHLLAGLAERQASGLAKIETLAAGQKRIDQVLLSKGLVPK